LITTTVGGINPKLEMRIRDVPEMNYYTNFIDDNGASKPRGEILFRGNTVTPGYFKNPEETARMFDENGWL